MIAAYGHQAGALSPSYEAVSSGDMLGAALAGLPSAAALAGARSRIIDWWSRAYLDDRALRVRFMLEASAALPILDADSPTSIHAALDWRPLRLRQNQQVPEWTRRNMLSVA
ncbi:hypothetical protein EJC47_11330 [Sphingomonas sp. TF3]|uniref:hypothetical protein n=1 Tax=Sphingomonas sp. TF3 TaxID=2495580 RepID=UPI000F869D72|nr:hypothetical protein [Sphingomonas sp. TF3]RUN76553.1 hypothetical protein EJC47_11330 [Sphingomonas sp. TF3]